VIIICLLQSAEFRNRISAAFTRRGGRTPRAEPETPSVPAQTVEAAPWPS